MEWKKKQQANKELVPCCLIFWAGITCWLLLCLRGILRQRRPLQSAVNASKSPWNQSEAPVPLVKLLIENNGQFNDQWYIDLPFLLIEEFAVPLGVRFSFRIFISLQTNRWLHGSLKVVFRSTQTEAKSSRLVLSGLSTRGSCRDKHSQTLGTEKKWRCLLWQSDMIITWR